MVKNKYIECNYTFLNPLVGIIIFFKHIQVNIVIVFEMSFFTRYLIIETTRSISMKE